MPEPREISLDEFVAEQKASLDKFAELWRGKQAGPDAQHWPMIMAPGEWDEQLRAYDDMEDGWGG